jgi:4-hydroxy-2-oxoheptanedioate aldolase
VDLEHAQLAEADACRLVRHAHAQGFPAVVRVPEVDRGALNRLLEAGVAGIQLSTVRSVAEVRALVGATRFAPHGRRSVSLAHPVAGYGSVSLRDAVSVPPPLLIGQLETADTDDPLPDICSAGIEVAFVGVTDLMVDLDFNREQLAARVAEIERAALDAGIAYGLFAADRQSVPESARYVALSSDLALLMSAAREILSDGC